MGLAHLEVFFILKPYIKFVLTVFATQKGVREKKLLD
jgi:hypothetical protein